MVDSKLLLQENEFDDIKKIENILNIKNPYDWNKIPYQSLKKIQKENTSIKILKKCNDNLFTLLQNRYPTINMNGVYLSQKKEISFWSSIENQKKFLMHVKEINNCQWNQLKRSTILLFGGNYLFKIYKNIPDAVRILFPDEYDDLIFTSSNNENKKSWGYWKLKENQKQLLLQIIDKYSLHSPLDIKVQHVIDNGGASILRHFPILKDLILFHFPDQLDHFFKLGGNMPKYFWSDVNNQRKFLDYFAKKNNINGPADWYNISRKDIENAGGRSLFDYYLSLFDALCKIYPDNSWNIFIDRKRVTKNFWKETKNHRDFFDFVQKKLNLSNIEDLCKVSAQQIKDLGGQRVLLHYNSVFHAIEEIYPDVSWDVYKRISLPQQFWDSKENIFKFIKKLEEVYCINEMDDWYRISREQIVRCKGSRLLQKYGNLISILQVVYPDYSWDENRMKNISKRATQRWMFLCISKLFPEGTELLEDYIHPTLSRISQKSIQFDTWLPKYNLAFEYQGEHHYKENPVYGSLELYQERDAEKISICNLYNIKIVVIPYWWDGTQISLHSYIKEQTNYDKLENVIIVKE